MTFLTWRRRFIILFTNAFVIVLFLGAGYFVDRFLGSWPAAFIIGFILSIPASLALLIRLLKKDLERDINKLQKESV